MNTKGVGPWMSHKKNSTLHFLCCVCPNLSFLFHNIHATFKVVYCYLGNLLCHTITCCIEVYLKKGNDSTLCSWKLHLNLRDHHISQMQVSINDGFDAVFQGPCVQPKWRSGTCSGIRQRPWSLLSQRGPVPWLWLQPLSHWSQMKTPPNWSTRTMPSTRSKTSFSMKSTRSHVSARQKPKFVLIKHLVFVWATILELDLLFSAGSLIMSLFTIDHRLPFLMAEKNLILIQSNC